MAPGVSPPRRSFPAPPSKPPLLAPWTWPRFARVKQHELQLAPEKAYVDEWTTPYKIDPFTTSVADNLELLLKIDSELRAVEGVTLAETSMIFRRYEQWFLQHGGRGDSSDADITGAGYAAHAFEGDAIQKRSYPNSFGGQYQNKGYELVGELQLLENARAGGRRVRGAAEGRSVPRAATSCWILAAGLQIHESIGHPIELDRVLGMKRTLPGPRF